MQLRCARKVRRVLRDLEVPEAVENGGNRAHKNAEAYSEDTEADVIVRVLVLHDVPGSERGG